LFAGTPHYTATSVADAGSSSGDAGHTDGSIGSVKSGFPPERGSGEDPNFYLLPATAHCDDHCDGRQLNGYVFVTYAHVNRGARTYRRWHRCDPVTFPTGLAAAGHARSPASHQDFRPAAVRLSKPPGADAEHLR
jgi:hypothetical protein